MASQLVAICTGSHWQPLAWQCRDKGGVRIQPCTSSWPQLSAPRSSRSRALSLLVLSEGRYGYIHYDSKHRARPTPFTVIYPDISQSYLSFRTPEPVFAISMQVGIVQRSCTRAARLPWPGFRHRRRLQTEPCIEHTYLLKVSGTTRRGGQAANMIRTRAGG